MPSAERAWRRMAPDDPDFRVALIAAAMARAAAETEAAVPRRTDETVRIDRRDFPAEIGALLGPAGLAEKPPLEPGAWDGAAVAATLARFRDAPEYVAARPLIEAAMLGPRARMLARLRHHGAASPIWLAGTALERSGAWLRRCAGDADG